MALRFSKLFTQQKASRNKRFGNKTNWFSGIAEQFDLRLQRVKKTDFNY